MKTYCTLMVVAFPFLLQAQIYVDQMASGNNDGSSWTDAFTELQEAINTANVGAEIWVAEGTYSPTYTRDDIINNRSNSSPSHESTFYLHKDIAIYGGFAGHETLRNQRDWDNNACTLSGAYSPGQQCYHVVYLEGVSNLCVLDGFTITQGNANNASADNNMGGGLFVTSDGSTTNPHINNCTFDNNAGFYGAGVYVKANGGNCHPSFGQCQFLNNIADINGGAVYHEANNGNSQASFSDCTFSNNRAEDGAAIYNHSESGICSPTFEDCTFTSNIATQSGGGIYSLALTGGQTHPTINNCNFTFNTANYGGGLFNRSNQGDCLPQVTYCLFQNNEAIYHGGGVYNQSTGGDASATYVNCYFDSNLAFLGAGMYTANSGGIVSPALTNCTFIDNSATDSGGAMYQRAVAGNCNPSVINCTFSQNTANNGGASLFNTQSFGICTPTVSNTILWDNNPITNDASASTQIEFSIIRGNSLAAGTVDAGNNLLNYDPLFVDEANGDLRLRPCSPAVDNADISVSQYSEDLDGNNRNINLLDIGAFETQVPRVLVDAPSTSLRADAEYTDANGWTHYFDCTNNILLLSLKKEGQNIGTLGDGTFEIEIVTNTGYNSG
ncbi:MAG: hypothetical protein AAGD05_13380, partial [Bacteroidota bacterium]